VSYDRSTPRGRARATRSTPAEGHQYRVPARASQAHTSRPSVPAGTRRPVRRLAVLAVLAAGLAAALSGCGIRDTALPVDAGVAASRTACPPAPDATLSKLAKDASILPTSPAPTLSPGPEASVAAARSAAAAASAQLAEKEKLLRSAAAAASAAAAPTATPTASASPSAEPTASPSPTASGGTLTCLLATAPSTPVPIPTPVPTSR